MWGGVSEAGIIGGMTTVLFLMPQAPYPARQGTAIRNWGLVKGLAVRGHAIHVLCFGEAGGEIDPVLIATCASVRVMDTPMRSQWARVRVLLTTTEADLAGRLASAAFEAALAETLLAVRPDVVQVEGLEMARYIGVVRRVWPAARVVYDAHNAEVLIQRRAWLTDIRTPQRWLAAGYSALQAGRLARFERETLRAVDAVVAVSAEDAATLRALAGADVQLAVAANGLFLSEYAGVVGEVGMGPAGVVFTGKMDYRPNVDAVVWFCEAIWPRVRAVMPAARFYIVGQSPTAAVRALGSRPGVVVTGAVADVKPYIAGAAVYVAPLRMGGGTRFKLLEAMALGRAVVSTRVGAEGFAVMDGREVRLADEAGEFAGAVVAVLRDDEQRAGLGARGRAFVAAGYDWGQIVPVVEGVWQMTSGGQGGEGSTTETLSH